MAQPAGTAAAAPTILAVTNPVPSIAANATGSESGCSGRNSPQDKNKPLAITAITKPKAILATCQINCVPFNRFTFSWPEPQSYLAPTVPKCNMQANPALRQGAIENKRHQTPKGWTNGRKYRCFLLTFGAFGVSLCAGVQDNAK